MAKIIHVRNRQRLFEIAYGIADLLPMFGELPGRQLLSLGLQ